MWNGTRMVILAGMDACGTPASGIQWLRSWPVAPWFGSSDIRSIQAWVLQHPTQLSGTEARSRSDGGRAVRVGHGLIDDLRRAGDADPNLVVLDLDNKRNEQKHCFLP